MALGVWAGVAQAQALPSAEMTIAEYQAGPLLDTTKRYLHGVEAGLRYALAINRLNDLPVIYCQPPEGTLSTRDLVGLVDEELQLNAAFAADRQVPVAVVLLSALQRRFPCRR